MLNETYKSLERLLTASVHCGIGNFINPIYNTIAGRQTRARLMLDLLNQRSRLKHNQITPLIDNAICALRHDLASSDPKRGKNVASRPRVYLPDSL